MLASHGLLLLAGACLAAFAALPWLAVVAFAALLARAVHGVSTRRAPLRPKQLGRQELGFGGLVLLLLALGPLIGYFGYGYFSMFGGFVAELFPAAVRATGQGTTYNIGRMAGAVAPYTIGVIATLPGVGIGLALSVTSAFFLLAAALVFTLPNRSGQALDE